MSTCCFAQKHLLAKNDHIMEICQILQALECWFSFENTLKLAGYCGPP